MQLSVIICAHNPRSDYLARVLDGLKAQTFRLTNGSCYWLTMLQGPAAQSHNISWHPNARHVREEDVLGLIPARVRGIAESTGDLLVFVDDDNVLDVKITSNVAIQIAMDLADIRSMGRPADVLNLKAANREKLEARLLDLPPRAGHLVK